MSNQALEDGKTGEWYFIVLGEGALCLRDEGKNVIIILKWMRSYHREEFCDAPGGRIRAHSFNPHIGLVEKY